MQRALSAVLFAATLAGSSRAQADAPPANDPPRDLRADVVDALPWRSIGPANMGGRVTDLAVHPHGMRRAWYAGTAGGGVFKSVNSGTTWQPLFQHEGSASIGDVAIAPSDPAIVWVGTGEENARNSVSWGDGVYRSTDGGETFTHVGLEATFQIGHVEVHPHDPDVVYVAALGRLWGPNPERGVFRTRDGGATWDHVLSLDDRTGCIDVRLDPHDPNTVYACMYERMRDAFDGNDPAVKFGDQAGLYKSTDGGDSWRRLTHGLPDCAWGRSGLAVHADDPRILYATIETERSGWFSGHDRKDPDAPPRGNALMGVRGEPTESGDGIALRSVTRGGPAARAGLEVGDVVVLLDGAAVTTLETFRNTIRQRSAGDVVTVRFRRGTDPAERQLELTYGKRRTRAAPPNGPFGTRLGGQQANKQLDQGPDAFQTGGVFRSDDHGETWRRVNSLTERSFYYSVLAVDPHDPDTVYSCGVSLYASSDGGTTFDRVQRGIHVDFHAIALDPDDPDHVLIGCDGGIYESLDRCATWRYLDNLVLGQFYHVATDDRLPYRVYGGLQDNGTWTGPSRTRYRDGIRRADWTTIVGGDGFRALPVPGAADAVVATSQNGGLVRLDLTSGRSRRVAKPDGARFNWDTPFFLSPHNASVLYFAGNRVCRSFGAGTQTEILGGDDLRLGLTERGTATAFAESPRRTGVFWVGTDDGALWTSADGGRTWSEIHQRLPDLPGPRYVSCIEPSHHDDNRVYVTLEGHRSDDLAPYLFVSDDAGASFRALSTADTFPRSPCHVVRELPRAVRDARRAPDRVLFVGTEHGCSVSLDRGATWRPLGDGLPTCAVRDLAIQRAASDLVAATHGRGLFVLDIEPLTQLGPDSDATAALLFEPEPTYLWRLRGRSGQGGHAAWRAPNPARGAALHLWLPSTPGQNATLQILDLDGAVIRELAVEDRAGHHLLHWDTRRAAEPKDDEPPRETIRRPGARVAPGDYAVRWRPPGEHAEPEHVTTTRLLRLLPDPALQARRSGPAPSTEAR